MVYTRKKSSFKQTWVVRRIANDVWTLNYRLVYDFSVVVEVVVPIVYIIVASGG